MSEIRTISMPGYRALVLAGLASIGAGLPAWALEDADSEPLQQIVVVGTTPVPGMSVDMDKHAHCLRRLFNQQSCADSE
jgi:hypothetical protein